MSHLLENDAQIYSVLKNELERQNNKLELIASENFTSIEVMEATGSVMTNKYAEGYPGQKILRRMRIRRYGREFCKR